MNMETVLICGIMDKLLKGKEIINTFRIIRDNTENKDAAKFSISWNRSKGS
jgi:hypothetical protein